MHRYTLYILIFFLTFGIFSFTALKFYREPQNYLQSSSGNIISNKSDEKTAFQKMFQPIQQQETKTENPTEPFCNDKEILRVWNYLIKDKDFQEWEPNSRESLDCKEMIEIKEVDLNQDGNKEILLRGKNFNLCSPVGNCAFWIYERNGKNYRKLLHDTDYTDITELPNQIEKTKSNRYFNVVLKGHMTARDTTYNFYKFDGKKYKQSKCLVDTLIEYKDEKPIYGFMSCKKFFKRWENEN